MRPVALALLALFAAAPASSQTLNASSLQTMCSSRSQQQAAACALYIQGYVDGRNLSTPRPTICLGTGGVAAVAGGLVDYLEKNRMEVNLDAGLVLGNFLISVFPCPR